MAGLVLIHAQRWLGALRRAYPSPKMLREALNLVRPAPGPTLAASACRKTNAWWLPERKFLMIAIDKMSIDT